MDMEGIPLGVEGEGGMGPPSPIVPGQIYIGPRNEYGFQTPGPAGLNRDPGAAPRPTDPSTTVHRRIVLTTQDMPRAQADMDRVLGMCQARVSTQSLPGEGTLYTVLVPPQRVNALIQGLKQSNALRLGSDEPLKPIDTGEWVGIQIQVSPPR
jgi:hypothetical protein